jgi:putative alpha-1,2-mannosidase
MTSWDAPYITALSVNGKPGTQPWLPAPFAVNGGSLDYTLSKIPGKDWGTSLQDTPPSFGP